jgi:alpha-mannosidase
MSIRHGYEFNYKLSATQVDVHSGALPIEHSFAAVAQENLVLTAMKKAEDSNGLIFHLYEWAGKGGTLELTVPRGATGAVETDLMETPQGRPLGVAADRVAVPFRPYEIIAVRVDYPENGDHQTGSAH